MLLGEPERTQWDLNFVLFGLPVRVHPFFWLVSLLLGAQGISTPWDLLIWVGAVFLAILVHELGHALVMRAYGFHPWITLYGLGGMASYNHGGAHWSRGNGPLGQILISAAGPGAGFVLGASTVGLLVAAGVRIAAHLGAPYGLIVAAQDEIGGPYLTDFVNHVLFISIAWGLVNLLPVYPLDGGQIAREVLLVANPRQGVRQSLWLSIFTAAGLCAMALAVWRSWFLAVLFGFLAFANYNALQAYHGRRPLW